MSSLHVKYALVGGGAAGSAAAAAIRQRDPQGSILLVGQEHSRPYLRPALSKQYLRREKARQDLVWDPVGWYIQQHIELRTGQRVAHLDSSRRAITLTSGEEIFFDRLLIATGSLPKLLHVPGADLPNVFYLRTLDDADRLMHALDKAKFDGRPQPDGKGRGRIAVAGGGLLSVELAASLRQIGLHVDLLVPGDHPWTKFAGDVAGRFIGMKLQRHGIAVHTQAPIARIEGDGRVQRVVAAADTVECDLLIAAMGITINRELLRGTPIAAEKAILVDSRCQTNIPGIYAAGDCAAIFDPLFGKHRVLDHWNSARLTGAIAGANMAGGDEQFHAVSTFTSEIFDVRLQVWGEPRQVHHRLVRGNPSAESPDFAEIGVAADGRVAQVLSVGRESEHEAFERLVRDRRNVHGMEEAINDPSRPLE